MTPAGSALAEATDRWRRYDSSGDIADLDAAIAAWRDALATPDLEVDVQADAHARMGEALLIRHLRTGTQPDLEKALEHTRSAIRIASPDSFTHANALATLGQERHRRYQLVGRPEDLDEAVARLEGAVATARDFETRQRFTPVLASALLSRFELVADRADLERGVELLQRAVASTPAGSLERSQRLVSLSEALIARYRLSGALDSLDEAIALLEVAASETPSESPISTAVLTGLGAALRGRFQVTSDTQSLEQAVAVMQRAVAETPAGPTSAEVLLTFALAILDRSMLTNSIDDMRRGLDALESAVAVATPGSAVAATANRVRADARQDPQSRWGCGDARSSRRRLSRSRARCQRSGGAGARLDAGGPVG